MPTGQQYATNVPQTTLTGSINASATSVSVASSASWPSVPFTAVFDIGTSTQEPVDVTAVVGTTWTVTRNIDGTTGFSHAIGATVTHADIGRDFREARTHMDASTNVHGLTGGAAVVGDTQTQTLTNKTLTSPTVNTPTTTGGSFSNPSVTGTVAGAATYTTPKLTQPIISGGVPSSPSGTDITLWSNSGVLQTKDASGALGKVTPPATSALVNNFFAWTFDPALVGLFTTTGAGVIVFSKFTLSSFASISTVTFWINIAGVGLTAGQNFVGLYNSSGTRVAVSADQTALWAGTGQKQTSLGATNLEPGDYYIAFVANAATTFPQFAALNAPAAGIVNLNLSAGAFRCAVSAGGNTSLPASVTLSSLSSSNLFLCAGLL